MPSRAPSGTPVRILRQPQQSRSHHVSSRSLLQSALDISPKQTQPATFLLPFRSRGLHQAATQQSASPAHDFHNTQAEIPPSSYLQTATSASSPTSHSATSISAPSSTTNSLSRPLVLSSSLQSLLPRLADQKPHYVISHIHKFPYMLTEGDVLRLPFHMHGVSPGDILRFNRASILGSRDYTLKAGAKNTESYDAKRTGEPQYIDERLFECRVRVMGLETNPMMDKEKKKRRNRHRKVVHSKHKYTVLRVMQIKVKSLEELKSEKGMLVLEGAEAQEATA
ncbi:hypothetical protein PV08_06647 [Exophiala spinifera]|uniref:Large ribosomal subunit protein bL21m n=1 Tax=Exophiala spinifera TaxID=91928 RepID=A0A0D1ZM01_9EURO|nr:uncharacterized protein PV08_06647 [Exophiala spinifera]KIW13867.1 hypothetical protein PV08_06647 [Exophiala spinifera]